MIQISINNLKYTVENVVLIYASNAKQNGIQNKVAKKLLKVNCQRFCQKKMLENARNVHVF